MSDSDEKNNPEMSPEEKAAIKGEHFSSKTPDTKKPAEDVIGALFGFHQSKAASDPEFQAYIEIIKAIVNPW